jgi:pilus assembly protein Flp/PilA
MLNLCSRFARDESGATSIEYALIGALISVAIIVGASALGTQLNLLYDAVKTKVAAATTAAT